MPESALVHRATIGTVAVNVYCQDGSRSEYHVVLPREQFAAEELLRLRNAVKQAEMFIHQQEQLALVADCLGCGE